MRRTLAVVVALVLVSCTSGGDTPSGSTSPGPPRGGTLSIVTFYPGRSPAAWDPASYLLGPQVELYRCCLLRNLYSYSGHPAEEGGGIARPDLAVDYPAISDDGLTWTIDLREGIRYAPPYEDVTVVSPDVVRGLEHTVAFEREAPSMGGLSSYYSVIEGFDAYAAGDAASIAGLETPTDRTLVIHLTSPAGDLTDRLALATASPIPPGAADGHATDYVRFLAALGPYMLEGSDRAEPTDPAPGWTSQGVALVRNPSWDPASDDLRVGYVDRIEVRVVRYPPTPDAERRYLDRRLRWFDNGQSFSLPTRPVFLRMIEHGEIPGRVVSDRIAILQYLVMNLAVPPFDDLHVRRAVNLVLDRRAIVVDTGESGSLARPTWHLVPATMEGFRIPDGWQPSWAEGVPATGSVSAARREMARSRYDLDGDGRCDGSACRPRGIAYPAGDFRSSNRIERALRSLGIDAQVQREEELVEVGTFPPSDGMGVALQLIWFADFGNPSTYFTALLHGDAIGEDTNYAHALLGASPGQLRRWGYEVTSVPSIDDRIDRCLTMVGEAQNGCWTDLDLYVAEEIVPWAPLMEYEENLIISDDVVAYSFDAGLFWPAYDRIALAPEGDEPT